MADRSWRALQRPQSPTLLRLPAGRLDPGATIPVAAGFRHPLAPLPSPAPPTLLPLIGADAEVTPALERVLAPIARRARGGDREARDALYRAFEPKLRRTARRIRVPYARRADTPVWERDDVHQEGFLVFAALVDAWEPGIPFGRYVLANFPWRLRDAVRRGVARRGIPPRQRFAPIDAGAEMTDESATILEQEILVATLVASFEPPLDTVLRLHVLEGLSLAQAARRMGVSQRTTSRYWQVILVRLRAIDPAEVPRTMRASGPPRRREGRETGGKA